MELPSALAPPRLIEEWRALSPFQCYGLGQLAVARLREGTQIHTVFNSPPISRMLTDIAGACAASEANHLVWTKSADLSRLMAGIDGQLTPFREVIDPGDAPSPDQPRLPELECRGLGIVDFLLDCLVRLHHPMKGSNLTRYETNPGFSSRQLGAVFDCIFLPMDLANRLDVRQEPPIVELVDRYAERMLEDLRHFRRSGNLSPSHFHAEEPFFRLFTEATMVILRERLSAGSMGPEMPNP